MNVIQRPRAREFCATMQDYIIDTDVTITFCVKFGGQKILEEEYVPDAKNQVRVRRLGQFCALALWGGWPTQNHNIQSSAAGTFSFLINDVQDSTSYVIYSGLQTGKSATSPGALCEVTKKVTVPGLLEYASGFINGGYTLSGTDGTGATKSVSVEADAGSTERLYTLLASYQRACELLGVSALLDYTFTFNGGSLQFVVDQSKYAEVWQFRFKNVYDMPEALHCTGGLSVKGASEDTTGFLHGVERKFALKVTDEYTVLSGPIYLRQEYKLWHQLLNAREVEIRVDDQWLPIVITKQKLERNFRQSVMATVEFSFRMADAAQNGLIF